MLLGVTAGAGLAQCLAWLFVNADVLEFPVIGSLLTLAFVLATRKDG